MSKYPSFVGPLSALLPLPTLAHPVPLPCMTSGKLPFILQYELSDASGKASRSPIPFALTARVLAAPPWVLVLPAVHGRNTAHVY